MLTLYQFAASTYSEKVRLILDYKQLPYETVEVTPGLGQLEVFRLSGQRQVPVLKDGSTVVPDSTAIARYLEDTYPDRPLLPTDPQKRGLCLALEDWADESLGPNGRKVLVAAIGQYPNFRRALLPPEVPDFLKTAVGAVPGDMFSVLGIGVGLGSEAVQQATTILRQGLESLCLMLEANPYLLGDQPTLADFAVAGLSIALKFPPAGYLAIPAELAGKGVPGLGDDPAYDRFFTWRDRLYQDYRQRALPPSASSGGNGSGPTPIAID